MDSPPQADASTPPRNRRRLLNQLLALFLAVTLIATLILIGRQRTAYLRNRVSTSGTLAESLPELIREMEQVRGLKLARQVVPILLTREQLGSEIRRLSQGEDVTHGLPSSDLLQALGMIPFGSDLSGSLIDASVDGVLGFYEPDTDRLVIRSDDDRLTPLARITLVHELTHAVTDQRFNLVGVLDAKSDDELLARTSLVEGDAMLTMQMWASRFLSVGEQFDLGLQVAGDLFAAPGSRAPESLASILGAPYDDGLRFVEALYNAGGWETVDAAYRLPPSTSEQILHPEKYLSGEIADTPPPPQPVMHRTSIDRGELGELFFRGFLSQSQLLELNASDTAAGWDGDRYVLYHGNDGAIVASVSVQWDSPSDADDFEVELNRLSGFISPCVRTDGSRPVVTFFVIAQPLPDGSCPLLS